MSQTIYSPQYKSHSNLNSLEDYKKLYALSIQNPEKFWGDIAGDFFWFKKWDHVCEDIQFGTKAISWFSGGKTNLCYNALDRHLPTKAKQTALIWEGNDPSESKKFSYQELHNQVCQLANALKEMGVKKGDRVAIYMGMVPELAMSLLACSRIGAIHNVIFGGFSADSLKERILDCGAKFVLTSDGLFRGTKKVSLKLIVDKALEACSQRGHSIEKCLVYKRTGEKIEMKSGLDLAWDELVSKQSKDCEAEKMDAEDPLFLLYTSGSTGKPKGVMHSTAGYMVYVATTFKYVFDSQEKDIFWCTADIGWVTGHSYLVYGPLLNGATTLMFEGVPNYPENDRFWEIIEKYRVNIFYTAPTALRSLMRDGNAPIEKHDLSSLRVLGTVGEPINPEAWRWYYTVIGKERCPVVDTWWQTETGGIMISCLPGMPLKPGCAGLPFFGVKAKTVKEDGSDCKTDASGLFVIEQSWPAMIRGVWNQPERMQETYFRKFPNKYFAGDGAKIDSEGYIWFLGRVDDVLNVSGHRIGTAELESAFVNHSSVAEAAVVGFNHKIKGQGIFAFVTLKSGNKEDEATRKALIEHIAQEIGPIAKPDHLIFSAILPKTRSGKIMRRILRKIAEGDTENLGDTSTLADPSVVDSLLEKVKKEAKSE